MEPRNTPLSGRALFAGLMPVSVFTVFYLLAATSLAFTGGNQEFVFYIAVMAVLIIVVLTVHARVALSVATFWCLSLWGLAHMAGGLATVPDGWPVNGDDRVLYNLWLIPDLFKYDQAVHVFGFGVATWVCWQGMRAALLKRGTGPVQPTGGLMVLAVAAGMGLGAANEVVEFAAVLLLPNTNVGGYMNTGWDLVANLAGAALAATIIYTNGRRNR